MLTDFPDSLIPEHDAARVRTLHQYQIVNTTPELVFDNYTSWAAQLFGTPIALISLVDADYVWFKSRTGGPDITGLARDESIGGVLPNINSALVPKKTKGKGAEASSSQDY